MIRFAVVAGLMAAVGSPAAAQSAGDDWDLTIDDAQQVKLATVGYSSGQTIAVRCRAGILDVLVTGLPPLIDRTRYVETGLGDRPPETGHWISGDDGAHIFSSTPGPTARRLRQGGRLQLGLAVAPEPDSPLRRYALDLPAESASLDRVIEDCNTPLLDPRDELPRWNQPRVFPTTLWSRLPAPEFPSAAMRSGAETGFAVLSCIVATEGRLLDCRVEHESDHRAGFGESAVRSMRAARLSQTQPDGPQTGQLVVTTVRYQVAP